MGKVGLIIVAYNQKHNIERSFESLKSQSFKDFRVYFVDNNSSDKTLEHARHLNERFKLDINFIDLDENSGFAGGNNIGMKEALKDGCEFIFVLNNDIELDKECLTELLNLLNSDKTIGIVAPILFYWTLEKKSNRIQEFGGRIDFNRYKIDKKFTGELFEDIHDKIPAQLEVDFVSGGTTLIKSEVVRKCGMWDERYFAYGDEIDLSKRVLEAGFRLFVSKKAIAWHFHDWSKLNKQGYYVEYYLSARNKYLYFEKYKLYLWMVISLLEDLIKFPKRFFWFIKVCDAKLAVYYLKGILYGIMNISGKRGINLLNK
jgi:GT2 family glycosyltransferase